MTIAYSVGSNEPGCLPDSEPTVVVTFEEAKEILRENIKADGLIADSWISERYLDAAYNVKFWDHDDFIRVNGRNYWIELVAVGDM